jgi:transcription elongation factor GreA
VTTVRANATKGRISIDSPLGKAMLHHKVNDTVNVKVNDNYSYDVIIRKIEKLEDDGSDEMRKY